MKNNIFLKLLVSLPIILLALYFIPFLGICLIIFRYIVYYNVSKKRAITPIFLIIIGLLIFIPNILNFILNKTINIDNIPYLNTIVNSNLYTTRFIKYGKFILITGVIFLMISFVLNLIFNKSSSFIKEYIEKQENQDIKIREKNDLVMQEKREIAKHTHAVKCPNCGANNIINADVGVCKYCRKPITSKKNEN